jgi:hypothetical protein
VEKEGLSISKRTIRHIQQLYKSDMRSMINCLQNNQHHREKVSPVILTGQFAEELYRMFLEKTAPPLIVAMIDSIQLDPKYVMKFFFNYLIRNKPEVVRPEVLDIVGQAMHFAECNTRCFELYCVTQLLKVL